MVKKRVTWERKREQSHLPNSHFMPDSVRGFMSFSSANPKNILIGGHHFSHWTDGAAGAHRSEGTCLQVAQALCGIWTIKILWVPDRALVVSKAFQGEGKTPVNPSRVWRCYQVTGESQKRREKVMEREEKHFPTVGCGF